MPITPEDRARNNIDNLLSRAGWIVQEKKATNLSAGRGVAVGEFPLKSIIMQTNCNDFPGHTVKSDFADASSGQTALTVTPSYPFKSFWQPVYTQPSNQADQGFGVGIDPSTVDPTRFGINIYNESSLLHEALHGITGLYDDDIEGILGVPSPSVNISIYIKNNVLSQCSSFRNGGH